MGDEIAIKDAMILGSYGAKYSGILGGRTIEETGIHALWANFQKNIRLLETRPPYWGQKYENGPFKWRGDSDLHLNISSGGVDLAKKNKWRSWVYVCR